MMKKGGGGCGDGGKKPFGNNLKNEQSGKTIQSSTLMIIMEIKRNQVSEDARNDGGCKLLSY